MHNTYSNMYTYLILYCGLIELLLLSAYVYYNIIPIGIYKHL